MNRDGSSCQKCEKSCVYDGRCDGSGGRDWGKSWEMEKQEMESRGMESRGMESRGMENWEIKSREMKSHEMENRGMEGCGMKNRKRKNRGRKRQEWAEVLREALEVPEPQRKKAFLRSIRRKSVSNSRFILQQAAYIRKWVWLLSFGVFLTALAGERVLNEDILWLLSAMMPFLAVSAVTEYVRSEVYGMTELEMAARFSLKSVLLARMGVLGIVHLGTLCLVSLCGYREGVTVFRTGIYLLAPYLLTDVAALWLVSRMRGREALYACLGLAVIVGILPVLNKYVSIRLWQEEWFGKWLWVSAVLGVAAAFEWKKSMERTEELTWS